MSTTHPAVRMVVAAGPIVRIALGRYAWGWHLMQRMGTHMGHIIVGVDGSEEAARALRWAVAEARLRGAQLRVLHVYSLFHLSDSMRAGIMSGDMLAGGHIPAGVVDAEALQAQEEVLAQQARQLIDEVLERTGADLEGLAVEREAIPAEHPAGVLVERSREAELLVVGSRGRGGFTGLLLGSVSQQCTQHAACPVVVIPSRD